MTVAFAPLPRSILAFRGYVARYVAPSRMVGALWDAGADWAAPTALDFDEQTITAQRIDSQHLLPPGPVHPEDVVRGLYRLWGRLADELARTGRVIDATDPEGVTFFADPARTTICAQFKTWPAIAGVTTAEPWETQ